MATLTLDVNDTSRRVDIDDPPTLPVSVLGTAALGNAVFDAIGGRLHIAPSRPERGQAALAGGSR